MKKTLTFFMLAASLLAISTIQASGQCTPDFNKTTPNAYPDTLTAALNGTGYTDTVTMVFYADTTVSGFTFPVDSVQITSVTGLPTGVSYTCGSATCTAYENSSNPLYECLEISGTPSGMSGDISLIINYTYWVTIFGTPNPFPSADTITLPWNCSNLDPGFSLNATNLQVAFTDTSSGTPTSWLWDFGDGNISTQQNPTHTYATTGTYTTCLTVTNSCGTDSVCHSVNVTCPVPDPGFSFTASNLQVSFTDTSTNTPTSWLWDFGDGNISTQQNPTHTYATTGTYTTCLTVTNSCGTDSACHSVNVTCPVPDPGFSFTASNLQVAFTDTSSETPTSWFWDFGDGNTSTQQNPTHTYATTGTYTTCLTVTNSCGTDSACHSVNVTCPVPDPGFSFTASNLQVAFTDTSSEIPTSWLWDFGDGNISTQQNPTHTYATTGTYTTCLTVTNSCGTDSACHSVNVICPVPDPGFSFTASNLQVSFTDTSTNTPTSWFWDFGDGNTGTQQNPTHTYATAGTYTTCLTVTNSCGTDSACHSVNVTCPVPDPGFSFTASSLQVSFTDTSTNTPTSWLWDFGDGNISTQQNPTHTYAVAGTYTTCLTVINSCGTDSICHSITICNSLVSGFNYAQINLGEVVEFTDTSSGSPVSWLWDFGDGNTSTQQNPTYYYAANGTYTVCLTVTDECTSDSTCDTVVVLITSAGTQQEEPLFSVYPNPGHGRFTLRLKDASQQDYTLNVYDLQGKKLHTQRVYQAGGEISLTLNLAPGLYRVSMMGSDGRIGNVAVVVEN
ncbi:MAG: PKD domain-containing protein [Flavobacteriales bacterium]|nr:PKD domain-containing protein [Flavobacteriales bacterium]